MPVPVEGLDQHYALAPDDYFKEHDTNEKSGNALALLREAESIIGRKGNLLDIGSGRGELLRAACLEGWQAVGIEPSSTFAEHAARYSGAPVKREPIEQCGFAKSSFDVVILAAVLEHLYDPNETIREISRVLRPGGALYLDVPNETGLYFRAGNLYQKLKRRDWVVNLAPTFSPFHLFGFNSRSLRALLSKHGLETKTWRVYGGKSHVPARQGLAGLVEQQAAKAVTLVSGLGSLGTYIETWAVKR
jgi:SAM-dependent methyltransferase